MLKTGDKVARIDSDTNEVVDILTCIELDRNNLMRMNGSEFVEWINPITLENPKNYETYEKLTKDHEQRYQNFLHKQTVNEWFNNKEFSFEEKEAIYNSFNVILTTERDRKVFFESLQDNSEPNQEMIKTYKNINKFFTDNNF